MDGTETIAGLLNAVLHITGMVKTIGQDQACNPRAVSQKVIRRSPSIYFS